MIAVWPSYSNWAVQIWVGLELAEKVGPWYGGVAKRMGGRKTYQRTRSPEYFWTPPKRASVLLWRGEFVQEKTEHWHLRGVENVPYEGGGSTSPFWEGCHSWGFPPPSFFKGEKPTPKTTHPNKKSLRKQFSGLFLQTVLPLSFKLNKRHAERVWANCLRKLFSIEFNGVDGFLWAFLPWFFFHSPWRPLKRGVLTGTRSIKSWFLGRGWGQQLFNFQSPAVKWMARTSSLNCLSCRNPYQTPHSLNCLPPFHWKTLFFTEKCFVASPSQKSALINATNRKKQTTARKKGKKNSC